MPRSKEGEFYRPIDLDWWRRYLKKGCPDKNHHKDHVSLISNLGYNLQYLEYLDYQCRDVPLHYSVRKITVKTFILITMSVIEGIAFYLLTVNGRGKLKDWEEIGTWVSNSKKVDGDDTRVRSILEKKLDKPIPDEMTLDGMIKKLEKSKLVSITTEDYQKLRKFRRLRNKIHVYDVSHKMDTDWNSFEISVQEECRNVLGSFLKSDIFNPTDKDLEKLAWLN